MSKCVCLLPFGYIATGVLQHMLGEFAQDGDFVVWSLDIADFSNKGTSETDRTKVQIP